MRGLHRTFLIAILIAVNDIRAQQPASLPVIAPGTVVRIHTNGGRLEVGRIDSTTHSSIMLRASPPIMFTAAEIDKIWKRRLSASEATVLGGVVGAAGGVSFGILVSHGSCERGSTCSEGRLPLVTGILGGLIGGAIGQLFGEQLGGWKELGY